MRVQKELKVVWDWAKGKKTYTIALVAILYGVFYHDVNAIILGLTAFGLRHGLATEVANVLVAKKSKGVVK